MPESKSQAAQKRLVGLLIITTLGAFAYLLYHLREQATPFAEHYSIHAVVNRADAIRVGTPVTLAGIGVGDVIALEITDDNRIQVIMELEATYRSKIRVDSQATLINPTFGNPYIDISIGAAGQPSIQHGGEIKLAQAASLSDIIATMPERLAQLDKVIANHVSLSAGLVDPTGGFQSSLGRIDEGMKNFVQLSHTLLRTEEQIFRNLTRFEEITARSSQVVEGFIETQSQLNRILASAAGALGRIEKSAADLPRHADDFALIIQDLRAASAALRTAAPRLGTLIDQSQDVMLEADRTLRASQKNFLIAPHLAKPGREISSDALRDPSLGAPAPVDGPDQ